MLQASKKQIIVIEAHFQSHTCKKKIQEGRLGVNQVKTKKIESILIEKKI